MTLEAIKYDGKTLLVLDQLLLPLKSEYITVKTIADGHAVIKNMNVRGAPAIAIVGAITIAIAAGDYKGSDLKSQIIENCNYLVTSRPTAVNLSKALQEITDVVQKSSNPLEDVQDYAKAMLENDLRDNKAIGDFGAEWATKHCSKNNAPFSVITICNTGSLATAGYGTALGVIRSINSLGLLEHVFPLETRPYNQGARLTAYELVHDKLPATLITDSMAASAIRSKNIAFAVVGADRVAANGDTANKIGTFQLAVLCKHFGVKFAVAAPVTSIDFNTASGDLITIEERPADELTNINGQRIAAPGINVWNPAFDVTPNDLIDAIITDKGVVEKHNGAFDLSHLQQ